MEYHDLWKRLHTIAEVGSHDEILQEFDSVMTELKKMNLCACNKDATVYFKNLLCGDVANIYKLSRPKGTILLFMILHNLVNLKLGKPIYFYEASPPV